MWWGGEEEGVMSGGSSSDNTTPPVDIMAEEAFEAASSIVSGSPDVSNLKEQFAVQENLLGQLKNVLRSNEEKLQVKEKEVQVSSGCAVDQSTVMYIYHFFSGLCHTFVSRQEKSDEHANDEIRRFCIYVNL